MMITKMMVNRGNLQLFLTFPVLFLAEVKGVNPWAENLYDKYDQESNSEPSE
jgi:hypothetical protein